MKKGSTIVVGSKMNPSGRQRNDVSDRSLKYEDRYMKGMIAESVLCKTKVVETDLGDGRLPILRRQG